MKQISSQNLNRFIVAVLFTAVIAGTWDVWWHSAVGRDSFFEPPHLLLYSSVIIAVLCGIYGWKRYQEKIWKHLAFVLVLIPISAPFDELWHQVFGVEDLTSPLVLWSPPHLVLIATLIGSFAMTLPLLKKENNVHARRIFSALSLASILSLMFLVAGPLDPIGPWHLLGFYGAIIFGFILAFFFLLAERYIPELGSATLMVLFVLMLASMGGGDSPAPGVEIAPHDHSPHWLSVMALLLPAVCFDVSKKRSLVFRGGVVAFLWAGMLYGFSSQFFESAFQYGSQELLIGVLSATVGGILSGIIFKKVTLLNNI